jgi:hypothetical protein
LEAKSKLRVFGAGTHDLIRGYDETKFDDIRQNMENEFGMAEQAIRERFFNSNKWRK